MSMGSMMMAAIYDEYSDLEEEDQEEEEEAEEKQADQPNSQPFMKENSTMIHLIIFRSMVSGQNY